MDNNELLFQISQLMDNKLDELRAEMKEDNQKLRTEMKDMRSELNAKIDANSTQLLMQVAELLENQTTKLGLQYEHEVAGKINALNEETDILRGDVKDHDQRIHTVERKVGIAI